MARSSLALVVQNDPEHLRKQEKPAPVGVQVPIQTEPESRLPLCQRKQVLEDFPADIRWMVAAHGLDG